MEQEKELSFGRDLCTLGFERKAILFLAVMEIRKVRAGVMTFIVDRAARRFLFSFNLEMLFYIVAVEGESYNKICCARRDVFEYENDKV